VDAPDPEALDRELAALHARVDAEAARVADHDRGRLQCRRGCHDCCVDGLSVFEVEARRIRRAHPRLLASGRPHPPGACAFLADDGACRIYGERPYVCRTQGLPLRWWSETSAGALVEHRDICPLNGPGPALETLAEEACWLIGPTEDRLRQLQHRLDGGRGRRVALRSLFLSSD
jgi:hypothetical protein